MQSRLTALCILLYGCMVSEEGKNSAYAQVITKIESPTEANREFSSHPNLQNYCMSSDGISFYTPGKTHGKKEGKLFTYTEFCFHKVIAAPDQEGNQDIGYTSVDSCAGQTCFVDELFCENNRLVSDIVYCPGGCEKGACQEYWQESECIELSDKILVKEFGQTIGREHTCLKSPWGTSDTMYKVTSEALLQKYRCDSTISESTFEYCANGCEGFICKP